MSPPRITALERSFITGYWSNLFIGVWRDVVTVADVHEWSRQFDHMLARHPKGFVVISIVEARAPIPDARAREALAGTMNRAAGVRAMAGVQEATGFTGAAVRCVLLALNNMTSKPYPCRVFRGLEEAAPWLAPYVDANPDRVSEEEVVEAIEGIRSMCDPTRSRSRSGSGELPEIALS